jgi:hypothetical protein
MPIDVGDVPCADPAQPQRTTRNFVTDTNGGLADTLVFISDGLNTPVFPVQTETLELDFTNCLIEPYVSAAMVRQKLVARDATGLSHALRFMAEDSRIIGFEKTLSPNSSLTIPDNQSILFGRVSCGTHPWERAYVSLLRQPYFAVTDEHGQFAITNVPPGRFTLEARHGSSGGLFERNVRSVNLSRSGSVTVDFQISSKVQ